MKKSVKRVLSTVLCLTLLITVSAFAPASAAPANYVPGQWEYPNGWAATETSLSAYAPSGDTTAWNRDFTVSSAFTVSTEIQFLASGDQKQTARINLAKIDRDNNILATVDYMYGQMYLTLQYVDTNNNWAMGAQSGAGLPNADGYCSMTLTRASGSDTLQWTVRDSAGHVYSYQTCSMAAALNSAKQVGFITLNSSPVNFYNITLQNAIDPAQWDLSGFTAANGALTSNTSGEARAWYTGATLTDGFSIALDYQFAGVLPCETMRLVLGSYGGSDLLLVTVQYSNSQLYINFDAWDGSNWASQCSYGWVPVNGPQGSLVLTRESGSQRMKLTVCDTGTFQYTVTSGDIPNAAQTLKVCLATLSGSTVTFRNVQIVPNVASDFANITDEWTTYVGTDGNINLMANTADYSQIDYKAQSVQDQWNLSMILRFIYANNPSGDICMRILMTDTNGYAKSILTIVLNNQNQLRMDWQVYDGSNWISVYELNNTPVSGTNFNFSLNRNGGNDLRLILSNGSDCSIDQTVTNSQFAGIQMFSFIVDSSMMKLDDFSLRSLADTSLYTSQATMAYNDLIATFWDSAHGSIYDTRSGDVTTTEHGSPWERACMVLAMNAYLQVFGSSDAQGKLESDMNAFFTEFKNAGDNNSSLACTVGAGTYNDSIDDAGWSAMMDMCYYALGIRSNNAAARQEASYMLNWAKTIFDNAWNTDAVYANGQFQWLLYGDNAAKNWYSSLYAVGLAMDGLDIYAADGSASYRDRAIQIYQSMVKDHARGDGLYWCDVATDAARTPVGVDRPGYIHEAGSFTYLGGNMAMAVLGARLYRMTGDVTYLSQAIRTINAITAVENKNGVLLDDRDGWADGTFAFLYASEALTLPGVAQNNIEVFLNTSVSIVNNARWGQYYKADWSGGIAWEDNGTTATQIMTTANTVQMVIAAAQLRH